MAEDEWVEIEVAVDSGATETVMSDDTLNGVIDITENAACKRGIVYEVADGTQIPYLGERKVLGNNGRWVSEGSDRTDLCSQQNVDERQQDREQRQQSCL